ncbi:MAG: hypothetical protein ACK47B_06890 [Armatimonadota bacterium]
MPPTYTPERVAGVIATALTDPQAFGLPFGCWSLDRLQHYRPRRKPGLARRPLAA